MKPKELKPNIKNLNFVTDNVMEFKELYQLLLALGKSDLEAKKMTIDAIKHFYEVK